MEYGSTPLQTTTTMMNVEFALWESKLSTVVFAKAKILLLIFLAIITVYWGGGQLWLVRLIRRSQPEITAGVQWHVSHTPFILSWWYCMSVLTWNPAGGFEMGAELLLKSGWNTQCGHTRALLPRVRLTDFPSASVSITATSYSSIHFLYCLSRLWSLIAGVYPRRADLLQRDNFYTDKLVDCAYIFFFRLTFIMWHSSNGFYSLFF